jgi:N-methylhydantoinase B
MPEKACVTDPFTIEIIKEALIAAADEMFITLGRTSKSTIIYETLDYACGLTDAEGGLIAQANGVTGFQGVLTYTVRSVLEKFGADGLRPGDVIVTNDPYSGGGTHLSDVALVAPIFYEGELIAFSANKAHWTEVGGMALGSWTTDATEIYQEGLQFPNVKIWEEGRVNQALIDLIAANVRTPDMTLGDLYAGAASLKTGERRVLEICKKYGVRAVREAIADMYRRGEENTRQALARLPKGTFVSDGYIDDDGLSDDPIYVKTTITITDDKFTVDITGTSPQVRGPVNCSFTATKCAVRTIFMALTDPRFPANEGCFRPLEVVGPPGTIFSCQRPASVSTYWETMAYVSDLVWKALAPHMPDRLTAGHFLSVCGTIVGGVDSRTKETFILVEPQAGGWGAGCDKDGESGLVCSGDGETFVIPVEVAEIRYPIIVEQFSFNPSPKGAGKFRGGKGLVRDYRIVNEDGAELTATFGRYKFLPWGVEGGEEGSPNMVQYIPAGCSEPVLEKGKVARLKLKNGDLVRLITGNGGGWGDPLERDPELVRRDVQNGFITAEDAREKYGVVLSPETLEVDGGATEKLRSQKRKERSGERGADGGGCGCGCTCGCG